MPKFRTGYSGQVKNNCPSGKETRPTYEYVVDNKGRKELKQTGKENVYEKIQSEAENVKIENVLARVAVGDMNDFRAQGIYEDISNMPNNMVEAMQQIQEVKNHWKNLPNEIKEKYNYDVHQYIADAGSETWLKNMGLVKEVEKTTEQTTKEKEVDTGEENK